MVTSDMNIKLEALFNHTLNSCQHLAELTQVEFNTERKILERNMQQFAHQLREALAGDINQRCEQTSESVKGEMIGWLKTLFADEISPLKVGRQAMEEQVVQLKANLNLEVAEGQACRNKLAAEEMRGNANEVQWKRLHDEVALCKGTMQELRTSMTKLEKDCTGLIMTNQNDTSREDVDVLQTNHT